VGVCVCVFLRVKEGERERVYYELLHKRQCAGKRRASRRLIVCDYLFIYT
jgi:hypothetical protein